MKILKWKQRPGKRKIEEEKVNSTMRTWWTTNNGETNWVRKSMHKKHWANSALIPYWDLELEPNDENA